VTYQLINIISCLLSSAVQLWKQLVHNLEMQYDVLIFTEVGSSDLKVHKREKFFGSDFEFFTIL
jgi:hypothetical protein